MKKHPFSKDMDGAFPVNIDDYPEHMRTSVERLRRAMFARKIFTLVVCAIYYLSLVCLLCIIALVLAQATDRDIPMRSDVVITTPVVRAGDKIKMQVTPFRYRLCEGKVLFYLYDREGNRHTSETDWIQPTGPVGADISPPPFKLSLYSPTKFQTFF